MTKETNQSKKYTDIYWKLLDDSIQRLGELYISDEIIAPHQKDILESWDDVRKWRTSEVPEAFRDQLITLYQTKVLKAESKAGFPVQPEDEVFQEHIDGKQANLDYQRLLDRCIQSLGEQRLHYWALIAWEDIHGWYQDGVPLNARESIMSLQEMILTGLEKELRQETKEDSKVNTRLTSSEPKVTEEKNVITNRPQLQLYREVYASFYEDILEEDAKAIFEAEEEMANSNLTIGRQIYRVRAILTVYSQRKFLEWLKGICCKICNISWRKAYDLMYAYESRRFVERNRPDLLSTFDYQLQRFQCEARRHTGDLLSILEGAQESKKRYTLEEVRELFPPDKEKPPEEPYVSELRMSLKKILDDSLITDIRHYIHSHPGETFQSVLDSALRFWLAQYS